MKRTLFLHIGTEKTGTTSLQEYFFLNKVKLKANNIYYPSVPGQKNHVRFSIFLCPQNMQRLQRRMGVINHQQRVQFRSDFKQRFTQEINSNTHDILISSEHLSSRVLHLKNIQQIFSFFPKEKWNHKVIIYLRRQDRFLLSSYSTKIKSGDTSPFNFENIRQERYNYSLLLNLWESAFGKDNLIIRLFDKANRKCESLFDDFCDAISIDNKNFTDPSLNANVSLDKKQLAFLANLNKRLKNVEAKRALAIRNDIITYLEAAPKEEKLQLTNVQKAKIDEIYSKDNLIICKKYLNINQNLLSIVG